MVTSRKDYLHTYSMHLFIGLFYIAIASYLPFLSYWYSQQGLSNRQIGFLYSLGPLIGLVAQPVWGLLSDRFGIGKKLLMSSLLLAPLVAFGYLLAGEKFYIYIIVSTLYIFLFSAVNPNTEQLTISHAKTHGQSYGSIRVLGSISFAIAVTPLGIMYNKFGTNTMFVVHMIMMALSFVAMLIVKPADSSNSKPKAMAAGFRELLGNRYMILFLVCTFLLGIANNFFGVFFPLLVGKLGGEVAKNIGMLYTVSAISELPFMILSGYLLKRFGYFHILAVCALAASLRWFIISMEPSFGMLLASQMLNGITFGLYIAACINFIYEMTPDSLKTTGQTMFALISVNVSTLLASNGGGWIVDRFNFKTLYSIGSLLALVAALMFWYMSLMHRRERHVLQKSTFKTENSRALLKK